MIQIQVVKRGDLVDYVSITGHAGYDAYGKDIVCAAVSSIVITSINAMLRYDEASVHYKEDAGLVELSILKHGEVIDMLLANMIDLLKELRKMYGKYIKFK